MLVLRLEPGLSSCLFRSFRQASTKPPTKVSPARGDPVKPPRLAGSILRPSLFNVPQPRLKPQPVKTSMMIRNRIRARENRRENQIMHMQYIRDMREEFKFWDSLGLKEGRPARSKSGRGKAVGGVDVEEVGYLDIHHEQLNRYEESYERERRRSAMKVPPEMLDRVMVAKKEIAKSKQRKAAERKAVEAMANPQGAAKQGTNVP